MFTPDDFSSSASDLSDDVLVRHRPVRRLPLFVYGTLRRDECNHYLFGNGVHSLTSATVAGFSLLSLMTFPVALQSDFQVAPILHGELITLRPDCYTALIDRLDALEGYEHEASFYLRRICQVQTVTAATAGVVTEVATKVTTEVTTEAWIYVGNPRYADQFTGSLIPHGDWVRHHREMRPVQIAPVLVPVFVPIVESVM